MVPIARPTRYDLRLISCPDLLEADTVKLEPRERFKAVVGNLGKEPIYIPRGNSHLLTLLYRL